MFFKKKKKPETSEFFHLKIYFKEGDLISRTFRQRRIDNEDWPNMYQQLADWWLKPFKNSGIENKSFMFLYSKGVLLLDRDSIAHINFSIIDDIIDNPAY